jgi:hypothetical protein
MEIRIKPNRALNQRLRANAVEWQEVEVLRGGR